MPLLDANMEDRQELKTLPDNTEAKLRITFADIQAQKKDPSRNNLVLRFDVTDDPMVDDIRVWLTIPSEVTKSADPKAHAKMQDRMDEFCGAFDVTMPIDTDALVGLEGWARLGEQEGLEGEAQNNVRKFIPQR